MALESELDKRQIQEAYDNLINSCRHTLSEENLKQIQKAFDFACKAHEGVRRKSGEPYIMHPLAVATIVTKEIGLGTKAIISSILHDVIEDTAYTLMTYAHYLVINCHYCRRINKTRRRLTTSKLPTSEKCY